MCLLTSNPLSFTLVSRVPLTVHKFRAGQLDPKPVQARICCSPQARKGPDHLLLATLSLRPQHWTQATGGVPSPSFTVVRIQSNVARASLAPTRAPRVQPGPTTGPKKAHAGHTSVLSSSSQGGVSPHLPGVQLPLSGHVARVPPVQASDPSRSYCSSSRGRAAPRFSPQAQLRQSRLGSAVDHRRGPFTAPMSLRIVQTPVRCLQSDMVP
ncbi:hypothetical protein NDU88_003940 [Pleurodeles waltl]|uniref:Uncharacterized protein n=1 Tax=Pleurodeles waltl TaxID=8319 RepID=A0AAV7MCK6_PLEWA|nr:hypothetical protein NDU88_003940 [Pleurodeles waltl]